MELKKSKDLMLVAALVIIFDIALVTSLRETYARAILGALLVIFLPGYPLTQLALRGKIGIVERIVASIGFSIVIVVLTGIALNFTAWGITDTSVAAALSIITLLLTLLAFRRRMLKESK